DTPLFIYNDPARTSLYTLSLHDALPISAWSRITSVEGSRFDANTAYASVDRHQLQDFAPYIYRTRDQGRSWQRITTGLPDGAKRSEEHTSELQSRGHLVCRLLLEKKKNP